MATAEARILAAIITSGGPGTVPESEEAGNRGAERTGHSEAFLHGHDHTVTSGFTPAAATAAARVLTL